MLDTNGHIISWNNGAQRIKGYQGAEIIGKHFSCFYPPDDLKNDKPRWELEIAAKDGRFEDEGWRIRKDGSRFWASVIITAVRDESGKLIGFAKVTRDFTERMRTQEALRQELKTEEKFSANSLIRSNHCGSFPSTCFARRTRNAGGSDANCTTVSANQWQR